MCRKHVSRTFEKCGPFFYLGVAQLEKLFSYLNENMLCVCVCVGGGGVGVVGTHDSRYGIKD